MTGDLFAPRGKRIEGRPLYACVQMDPPWLERGGGKIKRGADRHYALMEKEQILDTLLGASHWSIADDAHLYCWATDNFLTDALWLVERLGFRYVRQIVWVKVKGAPRALDFETGMAVDGDEVALRYGIGQYARGAHEVMLFCVRGSGMGASVYSGRRDLPSCIVTPVPRGADGKRVHSRKPDAAYEWIEARTLGPRVEFFARRGRPGWDAWGAEAPPPEESCPLP